jgi:hypothetical protein
MFIQEMCRSGIQYIGQMPILSIIIAIKKQSTKNLIASKILATTRGVLSSLPSERMRELGLEPWCIALYSCESCTSTKRGGHVNYIQVVTKKSTFN